MLTPEAVAGGPIGKVLEEDVIEITIDRRALLGSVDFVGEAGEKFTPREGCLRLKARAPRPDSPKAQHDAEVLTADWATITPTYLLITPICC